MICSSLKNKYDIDAATYIAAVEAADGQSLEQPIRNAMTEFVVNCKNAGIWGAMKSSVLLCGPRTQAGAVVPLKGTAPTLTSFVGDYNRETGLARTSGTFNTNRAGDADNQNNKHVAVYPSFIEYGSNATVLCSIIGNGTASGATVIHANSAGLTIKANSASNAIGNQAGYASNLIGISINSDTDTQVLYNGNIGKISYTTTTPLSSSMILYGGGGLSPSISRVAFYSMGDSMDLLSLQNILNIYLSRLSRYFDSTYSMTDSDAIAYVSGVSSLNGVASMGYTYRKGINDFVSGCKTDGIWTAIKSCCVLCGSNNLAGALYPLVGTAPNNAGFIDSRHYNRNNGLSNAGRLYYLDSNRNNNADPQDDQHMCVYVITPDSASTEYHYMGAGAGFTGATTISTDYRRRNRNFTTANNGGASVRYSLNGMSRSNGSSFDFRYNGATLSSAMASQTPYNGNVIIFHYAYNTGGTDATLAFYSIGTSLNLSVLESRVDVLIKQLCSVRSL